MVRWIRIYINRKTKTKTSASTNKCPHLGFAPVCAASGGRSPAKLESLLIGSSTNENIETLDIVRNTSNLRPSSWLPLLPHVTNSRCENWDVPVKDYQPGKVIMHLSWVRSYCLTSFIKWHLMNSLAASKNYCVWIIRKHLAKSLIFYAIKHITDKCVVNQVNTELIVYNAVELQVWSQQKGINIP